MLGQRRQRRARDAEVAARRFFDATGMRVEQHFATVEGRHPGAVLRRLAEGRARNGRRQQRRRCSTATAASRCRELPATPVAFGPAGSARAASSCSPTSAAAASSGRGWHQAALKANKQQRYDDFIAVAEDLIARKVTSPRHLGIEGGSNGGLLVGAVMLQRPELFGAVVCQVPLLDMKRYHKLLAGASWMGEYGDPDDAEEWAVHLALQPVPERASPAAKYPPIAVHDLDARRPRASRPRAQDGGAHAGAAATTCCTTRTSKAAMAAPPTTSSARTSARWPSPICEGSWRANGLAPANDQERRPQRWRPASRPPATRPARR